MERILRFMFAEIGMIDGLSERIKKHCIPQFLANDANYQLDKVEAELQTL